MQDELEILDLLFLDLDLAPIFYIFFLSFNQYPLVNLYFPLS